MTKLEFAAALAAFAHEGQVDKVGQPYITHPLAVSAKVTTDLEKTVALLHDVLEDTFVTYDTLNNLFGSEIADRVKILSRSDDEPYMDYVRRTALDPVTLRVKLADLEHNMDVSRLPEITESDRVRLERYRAAYDYLKSIAG